MTLTEDIDEIYVQYCLLNKNYHRLSKIVNKSYPALKRYVSIKEKLSLDLYPLLNSRKKLTLSLAETLCKNLVNTDKQVEVYNSILGKSASQKKLAIEECRSCLICCDDSSSHEYMECCGQWICSSCFIQSLTTSLTGVTLTSLCCPFCRKDISTDTICNFTRSYRRRVHNQSVNYSMDPWRNEYDWLVNLSKKNNLISPYYLKDYLCNLYKLYLIYDKFVKDNPGITDKHHLGYCESCIKSSFRSRERFIHDLKYKGDKRIRIRVAKVQKECVNDEQLKPEIFKCDRCCESETLIKRCPHCGIKSLRPDGCNYVRCECGNHWCFVCNMRLPHSHEGHNVHYWIGNGSSAYDDNCRISSDHHGTDHVMKDCNCNYCQARGGAPMCATLDCENTVSRKSYTTQHGRVMKWGIYCDQCSS